MSNRYLLGGLFLLLATLSSALAAQTTFNGTGGGAVSSGSPANVGFAVSGLTGSGVAAVSLDVSIWHDYVGDVVVTLTDPQSNSHVIFERIGVAGGSVWGSNAHFGNVSGTTHTTYTFHDAGTANIWTDAAATSGGTEITPTGDYRTTAAGAGTPTPMNTVFSGLTAAQANGTWVLTVSDAVGGDDGDVNAGACAITITGPSSTPTAPTITTTAPTTATTGNLYTYTVAATGSPAPTFTISPTPTGWLSWTGGNTLTGTPGTGDVGTFGPFTITATNTVSPDDTEVFSVVVTLSEPEIGLSRGVGIADGGTDAVATVGVENQAMTALTYSIDNSGVAPLNLTGTGSLVVQSNASGCTAVIVDPTTNPINSMGVTQFTVTITPTAVGAWSVDISIANDDANENPYNFTISGTATAAPEPEIDITDPSSNAVASGGSVTIVGSAAGTPITTATFTITNSGNADLTISAATTGTDVNGASNMSAAPAATVTASNTTTFDVDFTPTNAGAWSTLITITNNDSDEGTYTITLSGTAQAAAAPEIAVEDPANVDITNGSTESVTNTGTAQFSRVYTILNSGAQALNLIGTAGSEVVISSQNNCTVTVTQPANSTLPAAGGSPTAEAFTLVITPSSAGQFSFNVSIANDDANENPFDWTFNGNTTTPSTGGSGGGGSGCAAGTTGSNVWFALLGLLGLVAVIRVQFARN